MVPVRAGRQDVQRVWPEAQVSERDPVQDACGLVPDVFENGSDAARLHVLAFGTRDVRCLTRASNQRERTIQQSNDLPDADVLGRPVQRIPAPTAPAASQQTVMFELEKNQFQ